MFHGVLRGDHHERLRQRVRLPVDADLALVHGFEQRRLRFRRGAVDLVGQQKIAEDGSGLELEGFRVGVIDGDAEDVAGQHIAGELQPVEAARNRARQRLRQRGLADAGHIFDEQMAARQQADHGEPHHFRFAANGPRRGPSPTRPAWRGFRARIQPAGRPLIPAGTLQVHHTKDRRASAFERGRGARCAAWWRRPAFSVKLEFCPPFQGA